jgi:signal transduction histidine kinase
VIQSSADTLSRRVLREEPDNRLARVIVEEIARVNRLITDFLSFARPPAPRLRVQPLAPIVQRAIQLAEAQAERGGVRVDFQAGEGVPPLEADENLIHQCVLNLLVNAMDATPENGRIEVRLEARAGGREAAILVRDSGPGIPPGEESRIFNPFHTTKEGGTGLGLSIVQQIVSLHGGRVEVSSPDGGGACFEVRLPVHGAAAPAPAGLAKAVPE